MVAVFSGAQGGRRWAYGFRSSYAPWDAPTRTFTGMIDWSKPEGSTVDSAQIWAYSIVFAADWTRIEGGKIEWISSKKRAVADVQIRHQGRNPVRPVHRVRRSEAGLRRSDAKVHLGWRLAGRLHAHRGSVRRSKELREIAQPAIWQLRQLRHGLDVQQPWIGDRRRLSTTLPRALPQECRLQDADNQVLGSVRCFKFERALQPDLHRVRHGLRGGSGLLA